jgi:hypothetical protein
MNGIKKMCEYNSECIAKDARLNSGQPKRMSSAAVNKIIPWNRRHAGAAGARDGPGGAAAGLGFEESVSIFILEFLVRNHSESL